jgi:hypothetical protein
MRLPNVLLSIALFAVCATGCKKTDEPIYHGKIRNTLNQPVHVDFYSSQADYNTNSNAAAKTVIPPYGDYEIPQHFEGGAKYYMDWFTEDYLNTNWGNETSFNVPNITPDMDPALSISQRFTYARRIFINGNQSSVKWKAVDADQGGSSVWASLSANQRSREIIINKDLTGTYSYKDDFGTVQKMDFRYFANNGGSSPGSIFVFFNTSGGGSNYQLSAAMTNSGTLILDTIQTTSFFPPENSSFYTYYFARQ